MLVFQTFRPIRVSLPEADPDLQLTGAGGGLAEGGGALNLVALLAFFPSVIFFYSK